MARASLPRTMMSWFMAWSVSMRPSAGPAQTGDAIASHSAGSDRLRMARGSGTLRRDHDGRCPAACFVEARREAARGPVEVKDAAAHILQADGAVLPHLRRRGGPFGAVQEAEVQFPVPEFASDLDPAHPGGARHPVLHGVFDQWQEQEGRDTVAVG